MSVDEIRGKVRSIENENRRRSAAMVGCGAVIVPSWLAVAWYLPDFRLLATVGLTTALWILYHAHRNTSALRRAVDMTSSPSLAFYRELLERELDWHRRLPVWFLPPAVLSTAAIALKFYSSARFAHTPVFFAMMAWIVGGAGVALVFGSSGVGENQTAGSVSWMRWQLTDQDCASGAAAVTGHEARSGAPVRSPAP